MELNTLNNKIIVKTRSAIVFVEYKQIHFFESFNGLVSMQTSDKEYQFRESLKNLEIILPDCFIRVHKSFIINKNSILELQFVKGDTYEAIFSSGNSALVSKKYLKKILLDECE
ncbi:LytR/AlgR family response regulator transcription factor [Sutcliffiella horikoshii]|nr:LytTR family DNA-binding domain-containing protein [Sutcliffiella horikoshii]